MSYDDERSHELRELAPALAYAVARTAELLVEAGGYDEGDTVDSAEQIAFAVTAEIYRRGLVEGGIPFRSSRRDYDLFLSLDGSLALGEDGMPVAYRERGLLMPQSYRDMAALDDGQFQAVLAHTTVVLSWYLAEVYDDLPDTSDALRAREYLAALGIDAFENVSAWDRIRFVQQAVARLAEEITAGHLDAAYQRGFLFPG